MKPIVVVGSINLDFVVTAERMPHPGETLTGTRFDAFTGGKGANQAVACARLRHPVFMIGKVGSDVLSTRLLADLRSAGVNTEGVSIADTCSGMAAITLTPHGENSIIVVPGANHTLCRTDLEQHMNQIAGAA